MSYCHFCRSLPAEHPDRHYHDHEYGFPALDDRDLLERLALEINQAGLSWSTILKKRATLQSAYANFVPTHVAAFKESDIERLLLDTGIIRHRGKIQAIIDNAKTILALQKSHGSFKAWLEAHKALSLEQWCSLFKRTFRFTGGEITRSFLLSTGYLSGAHDADCPVFAQIKALGSSINEEP
ncbi:MAG: DNA-3-methyladenine glycosylase I [Cardiobacteriaceae bacterium]|nr:DNA-3-methyladenine glycosylase I [Cardiobacteriaceae bacterium]